MCYTSVKTNVLYIKEFNASVIINLQEIRESNTSVNTNALNREMLHKCNRKCHTDKKM